ncbi:MAG: Fic family protein [Proteobacteria bacterium]|nr:Fic family protein [Pseudomonadota bacterium]
MPSLTPKYLNKLTFSTDDLAMQGALGECKGKQKLFLKQQLRTLESLQIQAAIESADSSNRLEGITAPPARIEALVKDRATPLDRSEQEIAGYRDVMELIHQTGPDMPITVDVVLQLHQWLCKYMPEEGGHWKTTDNEIVEKDADGTIVRVRFKALSAVETPQAMQDLIKNYEQALADGREPMVIIPLFILDFLCIHPYRDGNGRISRLLTGLLLYHAGYEVGRYISLEQRFFESSRSYYETLETSSKGWHEGQHDVMPWVRYFWGVMLSAYRIFEERVGNIEKGRGSKTKRIRDAVERKVMPFTMTDIKSDVPDISKDMIRHVLRMMKDEGRVRVEGRGRAARWIPSK